jgi:serine/threonine protein kinase
MPSQLGKYTLIRTLGSGANSKVKLALDKTTNRYFAVKILKKGNPNLDSKFLELVMTEVHTMSQLSHPNIVNLIEYGKDGVVEKQNGVKEPVIYIVLELATGGELFDYVATTGRFSEPIARFYFHQLMNGLEYVHNKGIAHRDLKPENVLYDQYFNLKIADFGFAAPVEGRDGSGYSKTKLGTESYMAPEIHMRKPYSGPSVDLFASAIILFITFTQHPPFTKAVPEDPFYRLLCANRADLFWKAHSKNKPNGADFFTDDFKNLITAMLQFDPTQRISLAEVKAHPWYNGPVATLEDIQREFAARKGKIDADNEAKRLAKEQERANRATGGYAAQRRVYRKGVVNRSHPANRDVEEESKYNLEEVKRDIEEYNSIVKKTTEFFTTECPDDILDELVGYFEEKGYKPEIAQDKYKLKV